jgi:hypothetical protein
MTRQYIEIDQHYIKEKLNSELKLQPTFFFIIDVLTKGLLNKKINQLANLE